MPQNEHIELFRKQYGKRLDAEERARKKRSGSACSSGGEEILGLKAETVREEEAQED